MYLLTIWKLVVALGRDNWIIFKPLWILDSIYFQIDPCLMSRIAVVTMTKHYLKKNYTIIINSKANSDTDFEQIAFVNSSVNR